jgi:hypothetical protein
MHSDTENKYKDATNGEIQPAIACSLYCTFWYNMEEQI